MVPGGHTVVEDRSRGTHSKLLWWLLDEVEDKGTHYWLVIWLERILESE